MCVKRVLPSGLMGIVLFHCGRQTLTWDLSLMEVASSDQCW